MMLPDTTIGYPLPPGLDRGPPLPAKLRRVAAPLELVLALDEIAYKAHVMMRHGEPDADVWERRAGEEEWRLVEGVDARQEILVDLLLRYAIASRRPEGDDRLWVYATPGSGGSDP